MEQTALLFTNLGEFLGEVGLRDGAFASVVLTRQGEELMGDAVASWQTMGVPFKHVDSSPSFEENVSLRHKDFFLAMLQWAKDRSIDVIEVTQEVLECWQLMARLPLDAMQRYAMLRALRGLETAERNEWRSALRDADAAVQVEQAKTRKLLAAGVPLAKSLKTRKAKKAT